MKFADVYLFIEQLSSELHSRGFQTGLEDDTEPFLIDVEPLTALTLVMDSARHHNIRISSDQLAQIERWHVSLDLVDESFLEFKEHQESLLSSKSPDREIKY